MKILVFAALLSLAFAPASFAKSGKNSEGLVGELSGGGYGLAGCGLGSLLFGSKPGMIQVVSSTSNGIYGNQTFGISSGTSNCDIKEMGMAAVQFIEVNREVVAKEAARGTGESLNNLAAIFQCSDQVKFGQKMQSEYGKVFNPSNDSYEATRAIINSIKSDQQLSQSCGQLG